MKYLVIVESPAKVKTINSFLGKDYQVLATKGHIRDLPKKQFGIKVKDGVVIPTYTVDDEGKKKLEDIKKAALKSEKIFIATDEDREGEAIGYHVIQTLKDKDVSNYPRIVFHEITKDAILKAIKNPRTIDMDRVNAQQTRRLLDRIVGYKLSPLLNSKIQKGLSAGRVQSVALKIAVDREREILAFEPQEYYKIELIFNENIPSEIKSYKGDKLSKLSINNEPLAKDIVTAASASVFAITQIDNKAKTVSPPPPFITSTLQQAASSKLGYSPTKTMMVAQKLYEGVNIDGQMQGVITYMRTDSVSIADEAIKMTRGYIEKNFDTDYLPKSARVYKNKASSAQEAHEAIRPVNIEHAPEVIRASLSSEQFKVYSLIYYRFLATQMANAKFNLTTIEMKNKDIMSRTSGRTMLFDGFYKITPDQGKDVIVPKLEVGEELDLTKSAYTQEFTKPPARYSEASLIKELEQQGIGRPSTYAPTIGTLQKRDYIRIENKSIFPEEIAFKVTKLLEEHFADIVDSTFTSTLERTLDNIATKGEDWNKTLFDFYETFMEKVQEGKANIKSQKIDIPTGESCPDCGEELVIRKGRFGDFISCSTYPKCKHTKNIKKDDDPEEETYPCEQCGGTMTVKNSRRGKFYGCSNYPECKNTKPLKEPNKLKAPCPKCGGDLLERFSKRGKFYGCSNYPKCDFLTRYEIIDKDCPDCKGKLFYHKILKTKTSYICINDDCKHTEDIKN